MQLCEQMKMKNNLSLTLALKHHLRKTVLIWNFVVTVTTNEKIFTIWNFGVLLTNKFRFSIYSGYILVWNLVETLNLWTITPQKLFSLTEEKSKTEAFRKNWFKIRYVLWKLIQKLSCCSYFNSKADKLYSFDSKPNNFQKTFAELMKRLFQI